MTTAYITHQSYALHNLAGHPEHSGRIEAVWQQFQVAQLLDRLLVLEAPIADENSLLAVHHPQLLEDLRWTSQQNHITLIDADTYALPASYEIARRSAGGVMRAVDAVMQGEADNALAAVRPPGHHATADQAMGFCLLSNVAIAARHAQHQYRLQRVMIVDYDVHHGNGTQDIFYTDDSVLFVSTHQYPFYPGSGGLNEIGRGAGEGYTVNIPFSAQNGDDNYMRAFQEVLWPVARRFQPQFIIVSAGFDAHWRDPLALMRLSLQGYTQLTRELIAMAKEYCGGRIVFAMEGGYDLVALSHGMRNIAHALLGEDLVSDPYGPPDGIEPDAGPLIESLKQIHRL